ncbi:SGNH hydrolase, partial [Sistotremastrum niveocremeum HHB9708]
MRLAFWHRLSQPHLDTIFLFGDSLTQGGWQPYGFAQKLAYVYARKFDVINRGMSGYNTEWAIPVLEQVLVKKEVRDQYPKARIAIIFFGANDACIQPSPQYVPIPKFKSNLTHIIHRFTSTDSPFYSPETKIILMTPPPINTYQRGAELGARNPPQKLDREFNNTKAYADAVKEVAAAEGTVLVDIWEAVYDKAGRDEKALNKYLSDGLHFTPEGYAIVFDEIIKKISSELPELHHDNLKPVFPPWDQIDHKNPGSLKARTP